MPRKLVLLVAAVAIGYLGFRLLVRPVEPPDAPHTLPRVGLLLLAVAAIVGIAVIVRLFRAWVELPPATRTGAVVRGALGVIGSTVGVLFFLAMLGRFLTTHDSIKKADKAADELQSLQQMQALNDAAQRKLERIRAAQVALQASTAPATRPAHEP
jgi:uncharacterized membrane protein YccC